MAVTETETETETERGIGSFEVIDMRSGTKLKMNVRMKTQTTIARARHQVMLMAT